MHRLSTQEMARAVSGIWDAKSPEKAPPDLSGVLRGGLGRVVRHLRPPARASARSDWCGAGDSAKRLGYLEH